jgi:hypothetical protein
MTLGNYGKLVKSDAQFLSGRDQGEIDYILSLPDEVVAVAHLEQHPHRWSLISPTIQRQRALINQSTEPNAWFKWLRSQENLNEKRTNNIDTILHEIEMLHRAETIARASEDNIPVEVAGQIAVIKAQAQEQADAQIKIMREQFRLQVDALEAKLHFAEKELEFKLRKHRLLTSSAIPQGTTDGREEFGEVRQRDVPPADRKKVGRLQQVADAGKHRRATHSKSDD